MWLLLTFLVFTIGVSAADLVGKWNFVWRIEDGERRSTITFTRDQGKVKAQFPDAKAPIEGTFKDNRLTLAGTLYSAEAGQDGAFRLSAELVDDELQGTANWQGHDVTFTAKRAN